MKYNISLKEGKKKLSQKGEISDKDPDKVMPGLLRILEFYNK